MCSGWVSKNAEDTGPRGPARVILVLSLVYNLGTLFFFKYFTSSPRDFPYRTAYRHIFFTFQIMSYTIDVYRGEVAAQRNIFAVVYLAVSAAYREGPIVRYIDIEKQLTERSYDADKLFCGTSRFIGDWQRKCLYPTPSRRWLTLRSV